MTTPSMAIWHHKAVHQHMHVKENCKELPQRGDCSTHRVVCGTHHDTVIEARCTPHSVGGLHTTEAENDSEKVVCMHLTELSSSTSTPPSHQQTVWSGTHGACP